MRPVHSVGILAALLAGCGGGGGGGSAAPGVYTNLTLAASSASAYEFGAPTTLVLTPQDQNGAVLPIGSAVPVWTALPAGKVNMVGNTVQVVAGATGLVNISADLTLQGSITKTSNLIGVTVDVAAMDAQVSAGGNNTFLPASVDIKAGGTVSWSGLANGHNVDFGATTSPFNGNTSPTTGIVGAVPSAIGDFPTSGDFAFQCDAHAPGMAGTVHVH
jgi:plastocyanin